jgi:hypothetical protein
MIYLFPSFIFSDCRRCTSPTLVHYSDIRKSLTGLNIITGRIQPSGRTLPILGLSWTWPWPFLPERCQFIAQSFCVRRYIVVVARTSNKIRLWVKLGRSRLFIIVSINRALTCFLKEEERLSRDVSFQQWPLFRHQTSETILLRSSGSQTFELAYHYV